MLQLTLGGGLSVALLAAMCASANSCGEYYEVDAGGMLSKSELHVDGSGC